MDARLRQNRNCGCSADQLLFLIALYAYLKARHVQAGDC